MVSVPYRGATFLNRLLEDDEIQILRFPSPIGELHFSIVVDGEGKMIVTVSVPYRGATFLNQDAERIIC